MKTVILSCGALLAFAGNSILCRLALIDGLIDAGSFTLLRLIAGIITLFMLLKIGNHHQETSNNGSWLGGASLFVYAVFFSYAYIELSTAMGALVLFGTVQISLILYGVVKGTRLNMPECLGMFIACFGFVYFLLPEFAKPSIAGLVFMVIAGLAWTMYTVVGQASTNPLADTAHNFLKTSPFLGLLVLAMLSGYLGESNYSATGVLLAVASGAITSGIGYALWYAALRRIHHTTAAISQLSVPVIAAILGVLFAEETIDSRLLISTLMVLGGILIVITMRTKLSDEK